MSETHILIRLLQMYIPRNWEFGQAFSKLRNFGGGGVNPQTPHPPGTPVGWVVFFLTSFMSDCVYNRICGPTKRYDMYVCMYPRERPGTHCTGDWVGPSAGLDKCGKSPPTGIRSPDRPARSQSLCRLSYRANTYET
jgi:hypothetical protein